MKEFIHPDAVKLDDGREIKAEGVWENLNASTTRLKVEEGWIVCYKDEKSSGSFFVPDPMHTWLGQN